MVELFFCLLIGIEEQPLTSVKGKAAVWGVVSCHLSQGHFLTARGPSGDEGESMGHIGGHSTFPCT